MKLTQLLLLLGVVIILTTGTIAMNIKIIGKKTPQKYKMGDIASDVLDTMNTSADPCQDFYEYACGGWMDSHEIPDSESRYSRSFNGIQDRNDKTIEEILMQDKPPVVSDYFEACQKADNNATWLLRSFGMKVTPGLVHNIYNYEQIGAATAFAVLNGASPFFSFWVDINAKNPETYIMNIQQGGISLPRTVYISDDDRSKEIMGKYEAYIVELLNQFNSDHLFPSFSDVNGAAQRIIDIETAIAKMHLSNVDLRDPFKTFNVFSLADVNKMYPHINMTAFMNTIAPTVKTPQEMNVATPDFFEKLDAFLPTLSTDDKQAYFVYHQINAMVKGLPKVYRDLHFEFFGKIVSGTPEAPTRQQACIDQTNNQLGMELGKYFVKKVFPAESKTKALEMIHAIQSSMHTILSTDDWMDDTTRQRAYEKLGLISFNIGYPDQWPVVKTNVTAQPNFFELFQALVQENVLDGINRIGKPIDNNLWGMTPATVNAYYNPTENKEVFPAAILQNPFFELDFPEAMNYGSIGVVEGHEQSHGFDDQGSLYDGHGKLESWWSEDSRKAFKQRAQCFVDQYNQFELYPGHFVDGSLCLGENIADNSGSRVSYKAYQDVIGSRGTQPSIVDGLTNNQLFFVSYAQTWCSKTRKAEALRRLEQDVHSPPRFRVIGVVQNHEAFAQTFQCAANTPMNPDHKCKLF
mmetsp:Transcript_4057/g.5999  ORF Transcript_4057/g.5999 Transcript_4057/m.5999 type:complete len:691 (+) Transcript_4057:18-2090(+)